MDCERIVISVRCAESAEGGGLLILPALFVLTVFHVFCSHYGLYTRTEVSHLQMKVQQ